ncbi:MAG: RuBisCO large subunit C-terminal-like domain-containing protein [Immundisolibacterales bacterium]|nr:RuBisCO large subunit C-terminal-like domain-containing protein [Immundisolibacterales bacterium]
MSESGRIVATYEVQARRDEVADLARRIAYEQTVEVPPSLVTDPVVRDRVLGRVETVSSLESTVPEPVGSHSSDASHRVTISYAGELASGQLPQLLNLLYGNVSIYPSVRLVDFTLPPPVASAFAGPRFGIEGLRRLTGVRGRPLLATALKPRGLPVAEYARLAGGFALGGGDLVKDDQNLVTDFEGFRERVLRCRDAVEDANARTGRSCLYFPLVSAPLESVDLHFDLVRAAGLRGVLLCPAVLGLDTARSLAARHGLVQMGHPSLTGGLARGMSLPLVFGTLFRLAGVDVSVFPDASGRFGFDRETCGAIRDRLAAPLGGLAPAWPCPAGGLQLDGIGGTCAEYGADAVLLVGGALLGHAPRIEDGTRAFAERVAECFPAHRVEPSDAEEPSDGFSYLPFRAEFEWGGRESSPYKSAAPDSRVPPFRGVRRVELVGRSGEPSRSDLRYFEVEAGGHTSRERHVHPHIIIGARGEGRLVTEDREVVVKPNDVAFLPPLATHQLRNETGEPFGFYCIVDHDRDRPLPA